MKKKQNSKTKNSSQSAGVVDRLRPVKLVDYFKDDQIYRFHGWTSRGTAILEDENGHVDDGCLMENMKFIDRE